MSNEFSMRALYTVEFPGRQNKGEDASAFDDRVRQSQNQMNQNFLTIQQMNGEIMARLISLESWASKLT